MNSSYKFYFKILFYHISASVSDVMQCINIATIRLQ